MSGLEVTENQELIAHFTFPEEFVGFQGHFPQKKVLPGICQIQCFLVMLEEWKKKKVSLNEIVDVKLLSPVFPSDKITCVCKNVIGENCNSVLNASIDGKDQKIAKIKLKISF